MKILILSDTFLPQINGVSTSIDTFRQEYEKMGHEVVIIGPKVSRTNETEDNVWRFRSVPFPFQKEYRLISPISRKLKNFKDYNFDILHGQTPFSLGYLSLYLGKKHHLPIIHTYHTYFEKYMHYIPLMPKKMGVKYAKFESKKFYNKCQRIVVPSSQMKSALQAYQINRPIDVIPTGVKMDRKPDSKKTEAFIKKWKIDPGVPTLIFVGRLGQEKNVRFLMEAFKQIKEEIPCQLLVVGDGPERDWMEMECIKHHKEHDVIFTGYLSHEDVFTAYSASSIIVFPSKTETQGLSLLEGLSVGKPAVCINSMGVADILGGNRGGFLCHDSLDNVSQAVISLASDEQLYLEKSQDAIKRSQEFSAKKMAEKMISVYEKTIHDFK